MSERSVIGKITPANYAPKRIHGLKEDQKELVLGSIVGNATGIFTGTNPVDGSVFKGLKGAFEYTDADPERDVLTSGKMFLPSGIDEMIFNAVEEADGGSVQFAFEVSVFRADNPQGYSWKYKPLMKAAEVDPLSELRKLAAERRALALAAPEGETKPDAKAEPEKVAAKK
jgi:hypothetical protein